MIESVFFDENNKGLFIPMRQALKRPCGIPLPDAFLFSTRVEVQKKSFLLSGNAAQ